MPATDPSLPAPASAVRAALLTAGILAVLYLAAGVAGWAGTPVAIWTGTVLSAGMPAAGGVWALTRARRWTGRPRLAWSLLGAAAVCWSLGNLAYSSYEVVFHVEPPFPGPPDVGFLVAAALLSAGALAYPAVPRRRWSLVRTTLDAGMVTAASLLVAWVVLIDEVYAAGGSSMWVTAVGLAYPLSDVLVVCVLLMALRRTTLGGRAALLLLVMSMGLLVVADSGYALLTSSGSYETGHPIDVGWWAGLFLIGPAAAVYRDEPAREAGATLRSWAVLVPYASAVVALASITVLWAAGRPIGALEWVLVAALGVLIVARQAAVTMDSITLTAEVKSREDELRFHAFHDALTQLPNRRWFRDELSARVSEGRPAAAVLFVDLDGFKAINDTYGHDVGDALLREWAGRLRSGVGERQVVARLGGDEFAVLVAPGILASEVAERICQEARSPFLLPGVSSPVNLSTSVGVAPWDSGSTTEEILRNADLAMYRAKAAGRNQVGLYERHLHDTARQRLEIEAGLRVALDSDGFELHYQPVLDLVEQRTRSVEALLRWRRGDTLVLPTELITVAEDTGLIAPIGRWALDRACADLAAWRRDGLTDLGLSVNVSTAQLRDQDFPEMVTSVLARRGVPNHCLTLEITERVLLDGDPQVVLSLQQLHQRGVSLSLDDFGTGYASLSCLRVLPVSSIKIDRTFVAEFGSRSGQLVRGVATLAAYLGLEVVAEGIETAEQDEMVRAAGITKGQGFFLASPMPAAEVFDFVAGISPLSRAAEAGAPDVIP